MLIKLDVGGFGSGVLAPVIKDVPYLNKILPDSVTEEVSTEDSQYAYTNLDDAINRTKSLRLSLQMPRTVQILMQIILHS